MDPQPHPRSRMACPSFNSALWQLVSALADGNVRLQEYGAQDFCMKLCIKQTVIAMLLGSPSITEVRQVIGILHSPYQHQAAKPPRSAIFLEQDGTNSRALAGDRPSRKSDHGGCAVHECCVLCLRVLFASKTAIACRRSHSHHFHHAC